MHESGGRIESVHGFYDGGGAWKVRFRPMQVGTWRGLTASEVPELDGVELGPVRCVPSSNPLVRGQVTTDSNHPRRFAFEDETPFVPLGFECDWLFAVHQSRPDRFREMTDTLAERGFNYFVTNIYAHTGFSEQGHGCVYAPPEKYAFEGSNDAPDHSRMNVCFFRDYDDMVACLHQKGIVAHLMIQVQNKGVSWPKRGSADDNFFLRYVIWRYQAYPNVVWDVGKESYRLFDETGSHDYTIDRIRLIRKADVYRHLVTVHDSVADSAGRNSPVDDVCDFVSDQVHLGDAASYFREAQRRFRLLPKPYMNIEYGYEEGVEPLKTYRGSTTRPWQDILLWAYAIYLGGAYACYYYSNTAWDLVKSDPEPPGWRRYRYMADFLGGLDINAMEPDNGYVAAGLCLAEPGRQYLALLPEGGELVIDLTAIPASGRASCEWMDICSGERKRACVDSFEFSTRIRNPLACPSSPCVVAIRRART